MTARSWKCRKASCLHLNPPRTRKCQKCGKARPGRRVPEHRRVLSELSYEDFIKINGGEFCGICGRVPAKDGRRLDRDHDHASGRARGLLCHAHNRVLVRSWTPELLRKAADYLERSVSSIDT